MAAPLTDRQAAEAIEQFGHDLKRLSRAFDYLVNLMPTAFVDRVNAIPNQDEMDGVAAEFIDTGVAMQVELDAAEEAEDRRRANPLEPDFRRIG